MMLCAILPGRSRARSRSRMRATGQTPTTALVRKHSSATSSLFYGDIAYFHWQVNARTLLQQNLSHHTGDTTTAQIRRYDALVANQKQIRRDAFYEMAVDVAHQSFGNLGVGPLRTRQHLFESIQMFESGQCGLHREAHLTQSHRYATPPIDRFNRGKQRHDAPGGKALAAIASLAAARGDQYLQHRICVLGGKLICIGFHTREVERNSQPKRRRVQGARDGTAKEEFDRRRRDRSRTYRDRIEVLDRRSGGFRRGVHRRGRVSPAPRQWTLRKISVPLVPPNPNEFDSAPSIAMSRATFGT